MSRMDLGAVTPISVGNNQLVLTDLFENKDIKGIVIITKVHYLEIWDELEIENWRRKILLNILSAETPEKKEEYKRCLNQLLILKVNGYRQFHSGHKGKIISLYKDVVDRYSLRDGAILEGRGNHVRVWNPFKYEAYKKELEREKMKNMFFEKCNARKKIKK